MHKDRLLLGELLKSWAQEHHKGYTIDDPTPGDQGIINTGSHFNWIIKEADISLDLLSLLNKIDQYVENIRLRKGIDGMFCCKCQRFYEFAEANQLDGSMICYSCRNSPYT